jgi:hypothetical protein
MVMWLDDDDDDDDDVVLCVVERMSGVWNRRDGRNWLYT